VTPHSTFELLSRPLGTLPRWVIRHVSGAELEILAGFGAGLNGWRVPSAQGMLELMAGYASEEDLRARHADTSAGVRLSPFPNRLKGGKWKWGNQSGELPINFKWQPHAIHGLLHTHAWNFVSYTSDAAAAELTLERSWQTKQFGFPFPFTARTTFRMEAECITVRSETVNLGSAAMPYGEGWHPYFSLGAPVDELELRLPMVDSVLVDDLSIPTGDRVPFADFAQSRVLGDRFIDNCWAVASTDAVATTELYNKKLGCRLAIWQQNGPGLFRYIQAYTPPDRQSIAIEPMTCEPDMLNHHRDLLVVEPQQSLKLEWGAHFVNGV
jgi:aldose 1-epimerase